MTQDTICAISTAIGVGGISIIRVSGDDALNVVSKFFTAKNFSVDNIKRVLSLIENFHNN